MPEKYDYLPHLSCFIALNEQLPYIVRTLMVGKVSTTHCNSYFLKESIDFFALKINIPVGEGEGRRKQTREAKQPFTNKNSSY